MSKLTALALRDFTQTPDNPACELCHSMTNVRRRVAAASVCMVCGAHMCVAHMHRHPNYASVIMSSLETRMGSRLATPCSSLCKLCGMYMGCNQFWRIKPTQYRYQLISACVPSRIFNEWRIPHSVPDHKPEEASALVPESTVKLAVDSDADDNASVDTDVARDGRAGVPDAEHTHERSADAPSDNEPSSETSEVKCAVGVSNGALSMTLSAPELTTGDGALTPTLEGADSRAMAAGGDTGRATRKKGKRKKCNVPASAPVAAGRDVTPLDPRGESFHKGQQRHTGYRRGGTRRPWRRSSPGADKP